MASYIIYVNALTPHFAPLAHPVRRNRPTPEGWIRFDFGFQNHQVPIMGTASGRRYVWSVLPVVALFLASGCEHFDGMSGPSLAPAEKSDLRWQQMNPAYRPPLQQEQRPSIPIP